MQSAVVPKRDWMEIFRSVLGYVGVVILIGFVFYEVKYGAPPLTQGELEHVAKIRAVLEKKPIGAVVEFRTGELAIVRPALFSDTYVAALHQTFTLHIRLTRDRQVNEIHRVYLTTDPDYLNKLAHFAQRH